MCTNSARVKSKLKSIYWNAKQKPDQMSRKWIQRNGIMRRARFNGGAANGRRMNGRTHATKWKCITSKQTMYENKHSIKIEYVWWMVKLQAILFIYWVRKINKLILGFVVNVAIIDDWPEHESEYSRIWRRERYENGIRIAFVVPPSDLITNKCEKGDHVRIKLRITSNLFFIPVSLTKNEKKNTQSSVWAKQK